MNQSHDMRFLIEMLKKLGWTEDEINCMTLEDAVNLIELNDELNP